MRARLDAVVEDGRWRAPREFDARGPAGVLDGAPVISFASNDYLGLSAHEAVVAAAPAALERWGAGAGASRLVTGSRPVHAELEAALAAWKGTDAAVCFPTGFAANLGALSVLGGPAVRVLSDELNHASIIDGVQAVPLPGVDLPPRRRGAPGRAAGGGHNHPDHRRHRHGVLHGRRCGTRWRRSPPCAAAAGPCSSSMRPTPSWDPHLPASLTADPELTLVRMGTLSKTLGSLGGFLAGPRDVIDLMVNAARPYIFTTGLSPADAAAALAALGVLRSPEGDALVRRLADLVAQVGEGGHLGGPGAPDQPSSPIIPVILGTEQRALEASAALLAEGLWVPAIRPPTVPAGTSRLRVTVSAAHTDDQVRQLVDALAPLRAAMLARTR